MAAENRSTKNGERARAMGSVTSIRERQFGKLETQKDGRLFAIDMLNRMERRWGIGGNDGKPLCDYSATTQEPDPSEPSVMCVYRKGPQSDLLLRAHDELAQRATREAVLGFYVVMTDFVGAVIAGAGSEVEYYADAEGTGKLEEWGTVQEACGSGRSPD